MTIKFEKELYTNEGTLPPKWTSDAMHYYENEHGEQWIAKCNGEKVFFAGLDIGWEEIVLNYSQVIEYIEFQKEVRLATSQKKIVELIEKWRKNENPLSNWILNQGEKYWVLAVLHSAKSRMEFHNQDLHQNDVTN